jgi:hypothetical protein
MRLMLDDLASSFVSCENCLATLMSPPWLIPISAITNGGWPSPTQRPAMFKVFTIKLLNPFGFVV